MYNYVLEVNIVKRKLKKGDVNMKVNINFLRNSFSEFNTRLNEEKEKINTDFENLMGYLLNRISDKYDKKIETEINSVYYNYNNIKSRLKKLEKLLIKKLSLL
jgi:hypothetical protein